MKSDASPPSPPLQAARTRAYRSPVRAEQRRRTRERILDAARRLFDTDGFGATTIAAIATEAEVSAQTIYSTFGSKPAVLRAVVEQMEIGADADEWRRRIADSDDPEEILRLWAGWTAAFFSASRPVAALAQDLPNAAELAAEGDRHRREALRSLVDRLSGITTMTDQTPERLIDRAWALCGLSVYLSLVGECGWSDEEYTQWLGMTLQQQLLAH
ncbi:TetR/AcrR family transcriptional regulator [Naumannella halotolerans]|uniref:AcrR family transcriptional regulator n=1 Tax=Naumannella halotolerans TaxID=993414 RepID=A0A4R7J6C7_9ACTN|nr:TetR/AcrR family transcriptional regulator [Naumannella halotolerans]TDT32942.1 AcrR family transcriptional regulator [Naumannella halotolerans]